jgi:hypothetical protein
MQAHARRPGDASPNGGAGGGAHSKRLKRSGRRRQPLRDADRAARIAAWIGAVGVGWADI